MDIAHQLQQIAVGIHQDRLIPAPEKLAVAAVTPVEALGVDSVDMAHAPRDVGIWRLHEQMIVVWHQAIGANMDIPGRRGFLEKLDKYSVILVVIKYALSPAATVHYVIPGVGVFYAQGA